MQYHAHVYTVLSVGVYTHAPEFSLLALSVLTTTVLKKKKSRPYSLRPESMTSSCLRQARATALAGALPHFPKRPVQKKLAHGKSFHSTILQMRLTIPSQFKPTTSELCFRSISAHQRQFVGSLAERVHVCISLQPAELCLCTAVPLQ